MTSFRQAFFWIGFFAILGSFSAFIYEKENIRHNGRELLLPLQPVDPRSLIQGDYMRLVFAQSVQPPLAMQQIMTVKGQLVFHRGDKNIGSYVHVYRNGDLDVDEVLLNYEIKGQGTGRPRIIYTTDSFLFGEAQAHDFDQAAYAIFKADRKGNALITGLADEDGKAIRP